MKSCGIVCEYNPFHTGHAYHISKSKEITNADVIIGVMANHFVQRGEVACVSAKERAIEAIKHGMNLVVELPYPYCLEGADNYAFGAISVLDQLNCNYICFGSESNSLEMLKQIATYQEQTMYNPTQSYLNQSGVSTSNDILGVAYLKAIENTSITPFTIQRTNTYTSHSLETKHASASALRQAFQDNMDISNYTNLKDSIEIIPLENYYPYIRTILGTLSPSYLSTIFLMEEGIENLLIKNAREYDTYEVFLNHCVTKKYTKARIQRTLWHLLLQTTKEEAKQLKELHFVRILAADEIGLKYLKEIKRNENLELISKFPSLPLLYRNYINKVHTLLYLNNEKKYEEELLYPYL